MTATLLTLPLHQESRGSNRNFANTAISVCGDGAKQPHLAFSSNLVAISGLNPILLVKNVENVFCVFESPLQTTIRIDSGYSNGAKAPPLAARPEWCEEVAWKRLAQIKRHSRNGPWTRNRSYS